MGLYLKTERLISIGREILQLKLVIKSEPFRNLKSSFPSSSNAWFHYRFIWWRIPLLFSWTGIELGVKGMDILLLNVVH